MAGALNAYEQEWREKVYAVVISNRQGGPERVIDFVLSRLSGPDANLEDVASFEERKAIVHGYSQIAGAQPFGSSDWAGWHAENSRRAPLGPRSNGSIARPAPRSSSPAELGW